MLKIATAALFLLAGGASAFAQAPAAPAATPPAPPAAADVPPLPTSVDCTFTKAFLCEKDKGCAESKQLGEIDLPAHFLLHFGERVIASVDDNGVPHLSTIDSVSGAGPALTLQGAEGELAWVLQLSRADNDVTLTTVDDDSVLTSFGTCKAPG